ncbi:MAG: class I SAM-dependent methyltransferase [Bacteroidetes bacterium SW_9_63_38]|nr:MAG: class I SAM-dependent methyltransferase [Bacteroidetes bacterium SW_9_63_38]
MPAEPYSALAAGYDLVMAHVDYDAWAAYLFDLLRRYGNDVDRVVELGGGTGSLARRLQPLGEYEYVLSDGSTAMLARAREKVRRDDAPIRCVQANFTDVSRATLDLEGSADAVILVYDGLNYLLDEADVQALFRNVHQLLRPGAVAIIDQSTPANSQAHHDEFVDEGAAEQFSYVRENHYDPETRRHETVFDITVDGEHRIERHVQRAYSRHEVRSLLGASPLAIEAAYDSLTTDPADDDSYRVHWVLRRPQ